MRLNRREGSSLTTTAVAALLVLVTGCGASTGSGGRACTEIGAVSGVGLTVARELAGDVREAELQVCWDETCERIPLDLRPGQRTVDLGCESDQPDAVCSATSTPDGTLTGFAQLDSLPAGEVQVRAYTTRQDGTQVETEPLSVATETVFPNGEECPGEAQQLALVLGASGLRPQ
ncbi:hypothetical protein [Arthrobacter crystallopoietes]|jgi:hypothetical protein|uniref:Uncharacterized protein n=1 Tax=Crystallibacter crystallopoietes TaxID=37928 RepID=A0A1H1CG12_9MICC|nr:hypothetical protein [Arthrobacter crystallopoietes]AUI50748.1 hypothetical protein AC20117_07850 [Arthrobacter crystallopoietes]SDQ63082.1 hypothetical protein SAMN04489742_1903 [Arthrobacter crystallopoietes]